MKKRILIGIIFILVSISIWGESRILPPYVWDSEGYIEEPADENEPRQLLLAAMYHLDEANTTKGKKSQKAMRKSAEYINNAYRKTRRREPVITTIYSMINLMSAGSSKKLREKIRFSTQGINGFDAAVQMLPENFELMALRIISTIEVPTYFNNQTDIIIRNGEAFLHAVGQELSKEEEEVKNRYSQPVYIALAECMARKKNGEMVKKYLEKVNIEEIKDPKFKGLIGIYRKLEEKWL